MRSNMNNWSKKKTNRDNQETPLHKGNKNQGGSFILRSSYRNMLIQNKYKNSKQNKNLRKWNNTGQL